jgi:hypothetical protein
MDEAEMPTLSPQSKRIRRKVAEMQNFVVILLNLREPQHMNDIYLHQSQSLLP